MRNRHREKYRARDAVAKALKSGLLRRPSCCEACGVAAGEMRDGRSNIWGHHHHGYAEEQKLNVIWLCLSCHSATEKADLE